MVKSESPKPEVTTNLPATQGHSNNRPTENQIDRLFDVELKRIAASEKRTEVTGRMVEVQAEQIKLDHDIVCRQIDADGKNSTRRYTLQITVIVLMAAIIISVGGLTLYMAFFGDSAQQFTAKSILTHLLSMLGGGGILIVLRNILRSLNSR